MAVHAWSLLCHSAIIDRETNQLHIHDVVEAISVAVETGLEEDQVQMLSGPEPLVLVSYWVREENERPEMATFRIRIRTAGGEELVAPSHQLDLKESTRLRAIQKIRAVPFDGPGRMWFHVDEQRGDDDAPEWLEVAAVPLDVALREE